MSARITAFPEARTAAGRATLTAPHASHPRAWGLSTPSPRLRITRRGRLVVSLLVTIPLLALVVGLVLNGGGASASDSSALVHFTHVTVAPGESLWQVAQDVAPNSDPRDVVADIQRLNDLSTPTLQAGQTIAIPSKYEH